MDLKNKSRSRRIISLLIWADVILILVLIFWRQGLKNILDPDEYKLLWEVALITIGGGFIGLAFDTLKRDQDLRDAKRQYLRGFYLNAISKYNKVKKCRRLLRAKAIFKNEKEIEYLRLNECIPILTELEDCQLEFEGLAKEVDSSSLFTHQSKLKSIFTSMQEYLGERLKKFEKGKYYANEQVVFEDFDSAIVEFTKHYEDNEKKTAPFFSEFAYPFDHAIKFLIEDIENA